MFADMTVIVEGIVTVVEQRYDLSGGPMIATILGLNRSLHVCIY